MIPAPWAGPRRMQQAAWKSGLQGTCTFKKRIPNKKKKLKIPRTSQEEKHSLTAAISHCLTTLTNLKTFKLSQQTSPHLQIIIWMLSNQYQAKSPSRQGQQSCLCIPVVSGGKTHIVEPARTGSTPLGSTRRNTTQENHCLLQPRNAHQVFRVQLLQFLWLQNSNTVQQGRAQSCFTELKLKTAVHGHTCYLSYNPHQGFQHSFSYHLNRSHLISFENEMRKCWQKNFSLENFMLKCVLCEPTYVCSEHAFFDSFKSSLINAIFCPTLNMHMSQDLVGKGEKKKRGSGLVSTMLQQHWILYYCTTIVQCGSHPKHHEAGFFVLSIQKENKNVITLGSKLDMSSWCLIWTVS